MLYVWQTWSRVCGHSNVDTEIVSFHPGLIMEGTIDYDNTVRTAFSFNVTYSDPSASQGTKKKKCFES